MHETRKLITDGRCRVPCPVCRNPVTYDWHEPGDDVTDYQVPVHSEGLIGSGRRCYASGLDGSEALQLRDDRETDPRLHLRAHP